MQLVHRGHLGYQWALSPGGWCWTLLYAVRPSACSWLSLKCFIQQVPRAALSYFQIRYVKQQEWTFTLPSGYLVNVRVSFLSHFAVLGVEFMALYMLVKCSATKLHLQPLVLLTYRSPASHDKAKTKTTHFYCNNFKAVKRKPVNQLWVSLNSALLNSTFYASNATQAFLFLFLPDKPRQV